MNARTEHYNTVAVHVGKAQLVLAVVTIAIVFIGSVIGMAVTWGKAEERMTMDAMRLSRIERIDIPAIRQELAGMRDSQNRIIEIQVNLQTLMQRSNIPYQSVPRPR